MKYEIVYLKEKIVVGLSACTKNDDPKMGEVIGDLWTKMFEGNVCNTTKNRANEYAIGLYSDYTDTNYNVLASMEVTKAENPELVTKIIPAGKYAKFSIHGNMITAVAQAWNEIWKMDLDRTFTGDFEEYLNDDFEHADIDIYIAIK